MILNKEIKLIHKSQYLLSDDLESETCSPLMTDSLFSGSLLFDDIIFSNNTLIVSYHITFFIIYILYL